MNLLFPFPLRAHIHTRIHTFISSSVFHLCCRSIFIWFQYIIKFYHAHFYLNSLPYPPPSFTLLYYIHLAVDTFYLCFHPFSYLNFTLLVVPYLFLLLHGVVAVDLSVAWMDVHHCYHCWFYIWLLSVCVFVAIHVDIFWHSYSE